MLDRIPNLENISPDIWISDEQKWKDQLLNCSHWNQIPLLNCNASHKFPDGALVRFRGMIQDMHNPEFYFEHFEVYNSITNEVKTKSGKYKDTANILENEKINYSENLQSSQRHTMVVISVPGLNEWAQKLEENKNYMPDLEQLPNSSKRLDLKLKRSYDEADDDVNAMEVENESLGNKEQRTSDTVEISSNIVSREHILNFPLPDVQSKSCIVKVYGDDNENLKLNEIVEIVGFLSVDPALSGEFQPESDPHLDPVCDSEAETITHNPPPSLVPRLHAVYIKKLEHYNPLIDIPFEQNAVLKDANPAREHLLKALTELLLGDQLTAEYLICHLVASVYLRQEALNLGQFCLNISNLPTQKYPNYAKQLYDIIKQFVTKSYYLPLTIENMNTLTFLPKKDYECNRLTSGILQLSKDTHLVLDETQMEAGQLDSSGVHNIAALGHMIKNQRVEYDFKYYKMEFDSDVSVLVLSEGKSLLPSDYHIPLRPEEASLKIFDAIVEAATYYLKEDVMNLIRVYLTNLKLVKFTINEDLKFVEDDFIEMRSKSDAAHPVNADDLHRMLVLARLVSLSRGLDSLTRECWDLTKEMEAQRLHRVNNRTS